MAETLLDWLAAAGRHPEGGLRFVDRREEATWLGWGEVRRRAERVAAGIAATGAAPGDRVALVFPTCPEFFDGFFGALLAGAVPVPLYPPVRLGRMAEYVERTARMLELCGARLVLADPRIRRVLGEAVAAARPDLGCKTLDELPRAQPAAAAIEPAALALVQFSSGTTVDPKPVALSHRTIVGQIEILNAFWQDSAAVRHSCVSWLPLYHDMGLIGCVFPALSRDTSLTLIPPELFVARPAVWLRTLSRYRGTISPAPNFAYSLCLSRIGEEEIAGIDLSSWVAALNGAEAISPQVQRRFAERFAAYGLRPEAMTPVYGLSEAALAVTFSALDRPPTTARFDRDALSREGAARESPEGREIVSVGRPVPGFALRIVDAEGREQAESVVGRVWAKGPSLMDGYLGQPEATAQALQDGWLDTGDLGFILRGELYLTGRAKDVVILRGRNHSPEDIERAVDAVAGVRAGCVAAASWLPEEAPGEILALFVETARDAAAEVTAELPPACRAAVLAATGLDVDRVIPLAPGTLPRTSSGKLRRGETLRLYLAGELKPPDKVTSIRLARTMARSSLAFVRLRLTGQRRRRP